MPLVSNVWVMKDVLICVWSINCKNEVFISSSPMALLELSLTCFQNQMLWESVFLLPELRSGQPDRKLRTPSIRKQVFSSLLVIHLGNTGFNFIRSPPLLPVSLWFLLYVFSCGTSFLVGSSLLHHRLFLQTVVILMYSWEEMSSGLSTLGHRLGHLSL